MVEAKKNPILANRLFEYCVAAIAVDVAALIDTAPGLPVTVQALNDLGAYGWELYAVLPTGRRAVAVGFFRRDLVPPPTAEAGGPLT